LTTVAGERGGLLVEREVVEGCAAGRNDRRCWTGEALLGGRERDCWVVRPLRYWTGKSLLGCAVRWITAALLGGRDGRWLRCVVRPLRYWTGKALLGCAAGWERGDDGGLLDGAAGDKRLTTVAGERGGLLVEREVCCWEE
jgi:hypothetical protein